MAHSHPATSVGELFPPVAAAFDVGVVWASRPCHPPVHNYCLVVALCCLLCGCSCQGFVAAGVAVTVVAAGVAVSVVAAADVSVVVVVVVVVIVVSMGIIIVVIAVVRVIINLVYSHLGCWACWWSLHVWCCSYYRPAVVLACLSHIFGKPQLE